MKIFKILIQNIYIDSLKLFRNIHLIMFGIEPRVDLSNESQNRVIFSNHSSHSLQDSSSFLLGTLYDIVDRCHCIDTSNASTSSQYINTAHPERYRGTYAQTVLLWSSPAFLASSYRRIISSSLTPSSDSS